VLIVCLACTNEAMDNIERTSVSCQWLANMIKKASAAEESAVLTEVNAATMRQPGTFYCHGVENR